jgi:site-specific DNA recombinase
MRAAIYARRSTDHQEASIEVQIEEARRYIAAQGWELDEAADIYVDSAISRAEYKKRPALYAMLNAAVRERFGVLVLRDVDRLGGDTNRNGVILSDLFDRGVRVDEYLTKNTVRLDSATAKFFAVARNFAAEIEREKTSARTFEALKTKARRGLNVGGACYGYRRERGPDGTHDHVDEAEASVVREIFARYAEGKGLRTIVRDLNERAVPPPRAGKRGTGSWSASAVWAMLRRERYAGILDWGDTKKGYRLGTKVRTPRVQDDPDRVRLVVPALRIVNDTLWKTVQHRIAARGSRPWDRARGPKPTHLLSGLAVCGVCGGRMKVNLGKVGSNAEKVYLCAYHHERGGAVCGNSLRRPLREVDKQIIEELRSRITEESFVRAVLAEVRRRLVARTKASEADEAPKLEEQIKTLRGEQTNLAQAIAMAKGTIPALVSELQRRQGQLNALEARLGLLKTAPSVLSLEVRRLERETVKRLEDLRDVFARNPAQARTVMERLLEGKLTFTPIETEDGKRYRIEGRVSLGDALQIPADPSAPYLKRPQGDSNPR